MAPISTMLSPILLLLPVLSLAQSSSSAASTITTSASRTATTTTGSATTTTSSSSGYPSATLAIDQGTKGYAYAGCWNETIGYTQGGGVRALSGGSMNATDKMTVEWCLNFCAGSQYAGLEYGRECWCSSYLSSLSTKLPEGACGIPCKSNETTACGGSWALSLYNKTSGASSLGAGAGAHAVWSAVVVAGMTAAAGLVVGL